ncbi:hypothetical protein [Arcobacter sp. LA11]|uniref:hypothetical protein n=1 Tax=Arcobacter sp. LA11 TaxID=1898176 RepID=UPI000932BB1D|nr:hypothetical protein [Arcobacter sp. LA11]
MDYFTYKSFAYNFKASSFFLKNAETSKEGAYYNRLSSLLFSALTLESYINHKGYEECTDWEKWDKEQKPSIKNKIKKLYTIYSKDVNFNDKPFSTINILFKIRDEIVHGRTYIISKKIKNPPNNSKAAQSNVESTIERYCKIKKVKKFNKDIQSIIEMINEDSNNKVSKSKLWSLGGGSFQVKR